MGTIAIDVYEALGALSVAIGLAYLVRGANLPGRLGLFAMPASEEWRHWTAAAPTGYWQGTGVGGILFGLALLLIAQGCFHHALVALGIVAAVAGLVITLALQGRYGPIPRRTRGYWIRSTVRYTMFYVLVQLFFLSGGLDMCRVAS